MFSRKYKQTVSSIFTYLFFVKEIHQFIINNSNLTERNIRRWSYKKYVKNIDLLRFWVE